MDFSDSHRLVMYGRSKETIRNFISAQLNGARCVNCHGMYVPSLDMGRRLCSVHPRTSSGQSISPGHVVKYGLDGRSLPEHFTCCGRSVREATHGSGCTQADHWTGAERWMPLYPGEARDDVQVSFGESLGFDRSQHYASAWLRVLPTFILPLLGRDVDEVIAQTHAVEYTTQASILRPDGQGQQVIIKAGTYRLHVDLRDAYIHMTTAFGLPRECLMRKGNVTVPSSSSSSDALQETLRLAIPTYNRNALAASATAPNPSGEAIGEMSKLIFGRTLGQQQQPSSSSVTSCDAASRQATLQRSEYLKNPDRMWKVVDRALEPLFLNPLNTFFPFIIFSWMGEGPETMLQQ